MTVPPSTTSGTRSPPLWSTSLRSHSYPVLTPPYLSLPRSNWTIYPLPSESSRNRLIPRISDVMCFDTQPATVRVYCRVTAELDLDPFWNLPR
ncbi:hypothetical protein RRG08_045649, partial [Elysia crispata]